MRWPTKPHLSEGPSLAAVRLSELERTRIVAKMLAYYQNERYESPCELGIVASHPPAKGKLVPIRARIQGKFFKDLQRLLGDDTRDFLASDFPALIEAAIEHALDQRKERLLFQGASTVEIQVWVSAVSTTESGIHQTIELGSVHRAGDSVESMQVKNRANDTSLIVLVSGVAAVATILALMFSGGIWGLVVLLLSVVAVATMIVVPKRY